MSPWLAAIGVGVVFGILQYGWRRTHGGLAPIAAAALRVLAVSLLVALLLDAPAAPTHPLAPWGAVDVSLSMTRGDSSLWGAALDSLAAIHAESVLVFGDSARRPPKRLSATDLASTLRPAIDRATASGHSLIVITDGELDDPEAVASLPAGSRVVVLSRRSAPDVAVASIDAPRAVVVGDTTAIAVTVIAGSTATPAGTVALSLDGRPIGSARVDPLPAFASRAVEFRTAISGAAGPGVLEATVSVPGDAEPRNNTLAVAIDRSAGASAVFVSTSPDFDARYAMSVLRGSLAIPTRGFFRVAPGTWRVDGALTPVTEATVREALRDAPIAVIHGDTSIFGSPRAATTGPLALVTPARDTAGEWYAAGAPDSPLSATLSGVAWDSLAPISVSGAEPKGSWRGVEVRRGRQLDRRAIIVGTDTPRRVVIVAASGLWRWRFRGGATADAFTAIWGSIFDWLAAERADRRAALPDAASFRAEQPIRWRRGGAADSVVLVTLRRRNASAGVDSLTLRFGPATNIVTSPPLAPGIYDATTRGGASIIAVNAPSELVPRIAKVRSQVLRGGASLGNQSRVRDLSWLYVVIVLALCLEWLVRRKIGMR